MNTKLVASLEDVLTAWMDDHCLDYEWPEVFVYPDLARDMTRAVELVFDANANGQVFSDQA